MKTSNVAGITFRLLDWQDLSNITEKLVIEIQAENKKYDRLVALANGGLTMVRHLADLLGIERISLLQIKSYMGVNEHVAQPRIEQPLHIEVDGERLLIFEDIVDTGNTLKAIHDYLPKKKPASYQIATMIQKSHTVMEADFIGENWDEWIIFPYETRETIAALSQKWQSENLAKDEITANLEEIGFLPEKIQQFGVHLQA